MLIFTLIYVGKGIINFKHKSWSYFKDFETWLDIGINVAFLLISFHSNPFSDTDFKVAKWQYHVNGFAVFSTWLMQFLLIGRIPKFGLYIEVFIRVLETFMNVLMTFIFLLVAFTASFIVLLPNSPALYDWWSGVKILVLMLGEIPYDELFYDQNGNNINNVYGSAQIMMIIFIVLICIVIMNLLFGLAVADIQVCFRFITARAI